MTTPTIDIRIGDCIEEMRKLPDESVHCVVTSPPYYGLRDYGVAGQIGLEETPAAFLEKMVAVFREVRRVLRKDGTCWMNMGDSYAGARAGAQGSSGQMARRSVAAARSRTRNKAIGDGDAKPKDMMGMPWRLAFALQDDGWWLRQDIIWSKPNPMPESVRDRCTKAHEYIFLLTKSANYHFDSSAIAEASTCGPECIPNPRRSAPKGSFNGKREAMKPSGQNSFRCVTEKRNKRSVWEVALVPCKEAHFATYPPELIKPCILAGCPAGGTVLDPFGGSGTTGVVALELGRNAMLIELNPEYAEISKRLTNITPGFALDLGA